MFKKEDDSIETVIGPSVKVEGQFIGQGNVIVEGEVNGSLKTIKNLRVGPKAKITAEVDAENALVAGEIQGNVSVKERLELTDTAKIFGDIKTKILVISAGAVLNGKCQMEKGSELESKPKQP